MSKPTIVLVHGAYHRASSYDPIVPLLKERGYSVAAVELPSSGSKPGKAAHLADDRAAVRALIESVAGDVVVVTHSYGGFVVTHGLDGLDHKVKALVYLCAYMPEVGTNTLDNTTRSSDGFRIDGDIVVVDDPKTVWYHDFPSDLAEKFAARVETHSIVSFGEKATYTAWRDIPATYVLTTKDTVLLLSDQESMVTNAVSNPGKAGKVKVERLDVGHFPMILMPEETVAIIVQAATTV